MTSAQQQMGIQLGVRCQHDMDCSDSIKNSVCNMEGFCDCSPYFVQLNESTCLQGNFFLLFFFFQRKCWFIPWKKSLNKHP